MNEIELRVPANLCPKLLEGISVAKRNESVAFGLVSDAALGGRRLLLLKNLVVLPDDAYLAPQGHGARWSGRFTIEVLNRALREDCGVVILHEHTLGNPVRLSGDDITSGTEQLEIFARVHPGRPHGTAVVGRGASTSFR